MPTSANILRTAWEGYNEQIAGAGCGSPWRALR